MDRGATIVGATAGMYSGVDWMRMIDQLVAIEGRQINIWQGRKDDYRLERDAWRDVNMRYSNLKERSYNLLQDSTWEQVSVRSTDEEYVTATAAGGAVAGRYDFRIRQLATASLLKSNDRLNDHAATRSSVEVISGSTKRVDLTTTSNTWTQFDNDIDTDSWIKVTTMSGFTVVWLKGVENGANTINALMSAVMTHGSAQSLMRYDNETDTFIVESKERGSLILEQGGASNFFSEINITAAPTTYTDQTGAARSDGIGIDATARLSKTNLDGLSSLQSSGSFTVNGELIRWTISNTLNGIMSAINTSAARVSAFYDESLDRVILTNRVTGAYNIKVNDVEGNLAELLGIDEDFATTDIGDSAIFTINSDSANDEIGKNSNTFTIGATTFTLKKTNVTGTNYQAATPVTVTVAQDIDAIKTSITGWVTQWNSAMSFLKTKMRYDAATGVAGELTGDGTAMGIQRRTYALTTDAYDDRHNGRFILDIDMNQLAHIGITLGAYRSGKEGQLVINDTVLTNALTNRIQDVEDLFGVAKDGGRVKDYGVAYEIYKYTDNLTKSNGTIANQINLYSNPNRTGLIDTIDRQIKDHREYLNKYRRNLRVQFEAMERAIAQTQSQLNMLRGYMPGRRGNL